MPTWQQDTAIVFTLWLSDISSFNHRSRQICAQEQPAHQLSRCRSHCFACSAVCVATMVDMNDADLEEGCNSYEWGR